MAQLEAMKRYVKNSGGTSRHTADQLLHGDDPSLVQHTSPTSAKNHDQEEHDRHSKNSVLTKVKEKAKKLKNTLSKKKHGQDGSVTPASGVSLEDHNDKVDDEPEYYGAPMYESEEAPEDVKQTAKQHPREDLVISEKHVSPRKDNEVPQYHGAPMYESTQAPENVKETAKQHPREDFVISEKLDNEDPEYYGAPSNTTDTKTMTVYESAQAPENVKEAAKKHPREDFVISEKPDSPSIGSIGKEQVQKSTEPAKDEVALAPLEKVNTSKSTPASEGEKKVTPQEPVHTSKTIAETVTEKLAPAYAMASEATGIITSKIHNIAAATSAALSPKGSPKDHTNTSEKQSDKGVSVKEYLKQKLEPGEDEKALSQMISNSISPTKGGAVANLRGTMSSSLAADTSSPSIPLSTNAYQVVEEENEGRILQAN